MIKSEKGLQLFILLLASIILVQFYLLQTKPKTNAFFSLQRDEYPYIMPQQQDKSNRIETFKKIALKHGTDKVTTHHYEYVYGQIVGPIRFEKINFLEIGLGCGMGYGPGKSIPVWKEFMPNATISVLEYNGACAKPFESQVKQLFVGDQSDLSLMKQIGEFGVFFIFIDRKTPAFGIC